MNVDDVLTLDTEELGALRSPVMVIALTGLFDIAGAASNPGPVVSPIMSG